MVDFTGDVKSGLRDVNFEILRDAETRTISRMITSDLVLTGEAYQLIEDTFFDKCDETAIIPIRVSTDICGTTNFDLHITAENLDLDPCNCCVTVAPVNVSPETECFAYLNRTAWKQHFCDNYEFPLKWAQIQPSYMQLAILLLRIAQTVVLSPIIAILNFLSLLTGVDLNPIDNLLGIIDQWVTGAGRIYPTPRIKDILEFHVAACGLTLKTDIFVEPSAYCNEVILCGRAGDYISPEQCNDTTRIKEVFFNNAPVESVIELLDKLATKYNAEFVIEDGCLSFNRINSTDKADYPIVANLRENCNVTYQFNEIEDCATHDFQWCQDATEREGGKLINDYNDTIS